MRQAGGWRTWLTSTQGLMWLEASRSLRSVVESCSRGWPADQGSLCPSCETRGRGGSRQDGHLQLAGSRGQLWNNRRHSIESSFDGRENGCKVGACSLAGPPRSYVSARLPCWRLALRHPPPTRRTEGTAASLSSRRRPTTLRQVLAWAAPRLEALEQAAPGLELRALEGL